MSEWLDLMLEEISRKKREAREAQEEMLRRNNADESNDNERESTQSK